MAKKMPSSKAIRREAKSEGESFAHEKNEYATGQETPAKERKERAMQRMARKK